MATNPRLPVYVQSAFPDDDSVMDLDSSCCSIPADDLAPSLMSFNSEINLRNFLRDWEGRTFNALNELYLLPADEPEFSRLDKQHIMLLLALPGLYAAPDFVQRALSPKNGVQKAIMDIGTGGGNWAIAMAHEFPHAEVVGIDLAPSTSRPPPANCRFEFDDINRGLTHYYGCFDVVHIRACGNGFKDYKHVLDEAALCLRPGGVLLLAEGDFNLRGEDGEILKAAYEGDEKGKSWFKRVLEEVEATYGRRGVRNECPAIVDAGLGYHPAFESVGTQNLLTPVGPWKTAATPAESRILEMIGILMRQNSHEFIRAWRPLLYTEGHTHQTINSWIAKIDAELVTMTPRTYTRWRYAWGVKKRNPPPFGPGITSDIVQSDCDIDSGSRRLSVERGKVVSISGTPSGSGSRSTSSRLSN